MWWAAYHLEMNQRLLSLGAIVPSLVLAFVTGCASTQARGVASALPSPAPVRSSDDKPLPSGTPWNKEARADHLLGSIARALGVVQRELDQARAARDVIKVRCVDDKLAQLRLTENQARQSRSALRRALLDDDATDGPYLSIAAADDRARSLRAEARDCVGEELAKKAGEKEGGEVDHDADGIADSLDTAEDVDGLPESDNGARDLPALERRTFDQTVAFRAPAKLGPVQSPTPGPTTTTGVAGAQAQAQQSAQQAPRKAMLIRTAEIALAVYEVDKNLDLVEKTTLDLGGYLALRSDRQITVRVPRESFDPLVAKIERMGDVLHKNVAAEDVTDQWVDVEMRLKNATAVRARLEKLLEGATVRDAVEIHKELSKVTEEIERLQGKLKLLGDRVAYSTITVSFEPVQTQQVRSQALLPFPWMNTIGLAPLLKVPR